MKATRLKNFFALLRLGFAVAGCLGGFNFPVLSQQVPVFGDAASGPRGRAPVRLDLSTANATITGQFLDGTQEQEIKFDRPAKGRFFCLESLSAFDGRAYAAVAELNLLDQTGEVMDRSGWKIAYADSEEFNREDGSAENAIDGNPSTFWHTQWSAGSPYHPHHLIIDIGSSSVISGFRYLPRDGSQGVGGRIKDYRAYVGDNLIVKIPSNDQLPDQFYLLGYFSGGGNNGLQLAYSLNGYRWDVLNRGNPILRPQVGEKLMRDPHLAQSPDGTFHMVWTAAWTGNYIGYSSSKDLINWTPQVMLPVMADIPGTMHCWAPSLFWDARKQEFLVLWASSVADTPDQREKLDGNRIYYTRTKDFKTFSETKIFFDPGFAVLNAVMIHRNDRYYLVFKEEVQEHMRQAIAMDSEGPFGKPTPFIENDLVEAAANLQLGNQTVLLYRVLGDNRCGAVKSSDMERWDDISPGIVMPFGYEHGSVLKLPGENLQPFRQTGMLEVGATPAVSELGLGDWIWTTNVTDLQVCRLWRGFDIPEAATVTRGELLLTADNSYTVYLDGRTIGRGGDPNNLAEYDLTLLLTPGHHVLAVEAFNDAFDAGVILGLTIKLTSGKKIDIRSDPFWRVAKGTDKNWFARTEPDQSWLSAEVVGYGGRMWWSQPNKIIQVPPLQPPVVHFWQHGWVLGGLLAVCLTVAVLWIRQGLKLAWQTRSYRLLERERARIASDMHDDLGSGLTQLTLLGELILRETPQDAQARNRLTELCARARMLLRSMDEIVWTVNPRRDTVKDFAAFISEYAQEFLSAASIRCRQEVSEELPDIGLGLPQRRNLLLAVKEAIRNAVRHSGASEVNLKVEIDGHMLRVVIEDNGKGMTTFDKDNRNGLKNMKQRLADIGGTFTLETAGGKGCRISFLLPLQQEPRETLADTHT